MFVFCDTCKNHYDDTSQSKECAGVGVGVGFATSHRGIAPRPVEEHVAAVRATRAGDRPASRPRTAR